MASSTHDSTTRILSYHNRQVRLTARPENTNARPGTESSNNQNHDYGGPESQSSVPCLYDYIELDSGSQVGFTPAVLPVSIPTDPEGQPYFFEDTRPDPGLGRANANAERDLIGQEEVPDDVSETEVYQDHVEGRWAYRTIQHKQWPAGADGLTSTRTDCCLPPDRDANILDHTPAGISQGLESFEDTSAYDHILPKWLLHRDKHRRPASFRLGDKNLFRCQECSQHFSSCYKAWMCQCQPCSICELKGSPCHCAFCRSCHQQHSMPTRNLCDRLCRDCKLRHDIDRRDGPRWTCSHARSYQSSQVARRKYQELMLSNIPHRTDLEAFQYRQAIRHWALQWISKNQPKYFWNDDWAPGIQNAVIRIEDICGLYGLFTANVESTMLIGTDTEKLWGIVSTESGKERAIFRTNAIPVRYSTVPMECKVGLRLRRRTWDFDAAVDRNGDVDDPHEIDGVSFLADGLAMISLALVDGSREGHGVAFAVREMAMNDEARAKMRGACEEVHRQHCDCGSWMQHADPSHSNGGWGANCGQPEVAWDEDVIDYWVDTLLPRGSIPMMPAAKAPSVTFPYSESTGEMGLCRQDQ